MLLAKNVNFSQINKEGLNIFHIVAGNDDLSILKLLVNKFKNLNLKEYIDAACFQQHQTPLHLVAKTKAALIADYLINNLNANKEAKDKKNKTPLAIAAEYSWLILN